MYERDTKLLFCILSLVKKHTMFRTATLILLLALYTSLEAHPWKPAHFVIIDTDGGFDDMRAISMFMASPNIRVLAITSSNGVVSANEGYRKVRSFLFDLHHEGILTGANSDELATSRNCQPAIDFNWGSETNLVDSIPDAISVINYVLTHSREQISFICLGSLITASDCYKHCLPFKERVKEIIWTTDSIMDDNNFNYATSPESFEYITKATNIPFHLVVGKAGNSPYDEAFTSTLEKLHNPYSENIVQSLISKQSPYSHNWYDETAAIYLHYPSFFSSDTSGVIICHRMNDPYYPQNLEVLTLTILRGETVNQNQVLKSFPLDSSAYFADVQKKMKSTIQKYGKDEWVACVLGNELHRHLGVYAVIGVKMGIRAREYFGAGIDELQIHSYAGYTPPYSCMNDGLQVSTGGTLGHGLIKVDSDSLKLPKAEFTYLEQTIRIALKDEYRQKIETEINELSMIYGLDSNIYWELVRMAALNYWANWDRNDIFEIQH
jgi:inosine-uridine nucleoside N-ribohydrolase/formylmethanofuran dehydrogenase subunit E